MHEQIKECTHAYHLKSSFKQKSKQERCNFCSFSAPSHRMLSCIVYKQQETTSLWWDIMSLPKCVGVLHILTYSAVTSIFRMPLGTHTQCSEQSVGHTVDIPCSGALMHYIKDFVYLVLFIQTAFLLSSVGCINNSYIFCILSALYIFILWVCQHDVWEWKVCGPFFFVLQKRPPSFSILRRYCLTARSERAVLLGSISVFCTLQLLQWKPLSTPPLWCI